MQPTVLLLQYLIGGPDDDRKQGRVVEELGREKEWNNPGTVSGMYPETGSRVNP